MFQQNTQYPIRYKTDYLPVVEDVSGCTHHIMILSIYVYHIVCSSQIRFHTINCLYCLLFKKMSQFFFKVSFYFIHTIYDNRKSYLLICGIHPLLQAHAFSTFDQFQYSRVMVDFLMNIIDRNLQQISMLSCAERINTTLCR